MSADAERGPGREAGQPADEPEGAAADSLLAALDVGRHARIGATAGVLLAGALYLRTVLAVETTDSRAYYLGLALVLAATVAGTVTAALSVKAFLEPVLDRAAWLRRGGTAATAGGLVWVAAPPLAWLAGADLAADAAWRAALALGALALAAGAAALHATVRTDAGLGGSGSRALPGLAPRVERAARWLERAAYWLVVAGLLLAAGNATGSAAPVLRTDAGALATPFLLGAFLACLGAVPLAAVAELAGALPRWRAGALLVGAQLGLLAVAWLLAAGGWPWLAARTATPGPVALALLTVPVGLGWLGAGLGLRTRAATLDARAASRATDRGSVDD